MMMGVELSKDPNKRLVSVRATGTLTTKDYEEFVPEIEAMVKEQGKIRVMFEMHDCGFRGKPITIPGSSRSPFRNDSDHDSGASRSRVPKPITLRQGSGA
jgi:SpoIIAA-like